MPHIRDARILIDNEGNHLTIGEVGEFVIKQRRKIDKQETSPGAVATALMGSAAVMAKDTKVTRRFWRR